jgi:ribonuclease HI
MSWILSQIRPASDSCVEPLAPRYDVTIKSDSEYALKSIQGIYNGKKNRFLLDKARDKYSTLQKLLTGPSSVLMELPPTNQASTLDEGVALDAKPRLVRLCSVSLEHVKGHSGHKWNDRADSVALSAAK